MFRGHTVGRLSAELQLIYIAAHWAQIWKPLGGMIAMVDTIYLLRQTTATLDWTRITAWLDGSVAAPHVFVLLTYLAGHQVIALDPQVLQRLGGRPGVVGTLNVRLLHAMVNRYVVDGRPAGPFLRLLSLRVWDSLLVPNSALSNLVCACLRGLVPALVRACLRGLVPARWRPGLAHVHHRVSGIVGHARWSWGRERYPEP
jgi:hypothetical protein